MENDELWNRITAHFFKKTEVTPSEAFVQRVMARLPEQEEAGLNWMGWLIPSFGMGFAVLLFGATFLPTRTELSAENILFIDGAAEPEAQLIFSDKPAVTAAVLEDTAEAVR